MSGLRWSWKRIAFVVIQATGSAMGSPFGQAVKECKEFITQLGGMFLQMFGQLCLLEAIKSNKTRIPEKKIFFFLSFFIELSQIQSTLQFIESQICTQTFLNLEYMFQLLNINTCKYK